MHTLIRSSRVLLILAGALLFFVSCGEDPPTTSDQGGNESESVPAITWDVPRLMVRYNYQAGTLMGATIYMEFRVSQASGEVKLLTDLFQKRTGDAEWGKIEGDTLSVTVEEGMHYDARVFVEMRTYECGLPTETSVVWSCPETPGTKRISLGRDKRQAYRLENLRVTEMEESPSETEWPCPAQFDGKQF